MSNVKGAREIPPGWLAGVCVVCSGGETRGPVGDVGHSDSGGRRGLRAGRQARVVLDGGALKCSAETRPRKPLGKGGFDSMGPAPAKWPLG